MNRCPDELGTPALPTSAEDLCRFAREVQEREQRLCLHLLQENGRCRSCGRFLGIVHSEVL